MNIKIILFIAVIFALQAFQTKAQNFYWVEFTNKNSSEYSLSNPEKYLSERAIQRRAKQNISIDSLDLPVNSNYIDSVLSIGVELIHSSKWLNGITVKTEIDSFIDKVLKISFVKEAQLSKPASSAKSAFSKFNEIYAVGKEPIDGSLYGASVYQTGLMNGQFLHNQGYNGEGIQIAILDAGFLNADKYRAFDSLWTNNQILGIKDFVNSDDDFFSTHSHGMSVLSCIGGNVLDSLIGTARKASFWLLRSEDVSSEYIIEEDNWVAAAEFADSVGVDIINSSLGYYEFDDQSMDHTYADMDGKITRVTQGANIAASRGMLVFASAGNEGDNAWKYIIAPSDGDNVIGVGAVDKDGVAAYFTSYGPAADGDIKPNIAAVGLNTYLQRSDGKLGFASGTSFSSPVMAGMAASLWQAAPNATADEVKWAMEWSATLHDNPDSLLGYGIPDFQMAWFYLVNLSIPNQLTEKDWFVYPNPATDFLVIQKNGVVNSDKITIEIFTLEGRLVQKWIKPNNPKITLSDIGWLSQGMFLLKIASDEKYQTIKFNKIR